MKFPRFIPVLGLALALGCAGSPSKSATAKKEGTERFQKVHAGIKYNLASDQFKNGHLEDARKTVNEAIRLSPDNMQARLLSARLHIEQGNLELAEQELIRARSININNGEVDYIMGIIYQRWQKPDVALEHYNKACEKNPQELAYVLAAAETLAGLEQQTRALAFLREKLGTPGFENSPAIRDAIGQLLVQEGRYQEALPQLRQASVLAPDEQQIREHFAMALFYNKEHREALNVFERLLKDEKYKSRADLHTAIGECHMALSDPRAARDSFEVASQLDPNGASAWLNLSKAALQLNDLKRAEISLKKAMTIETSSADANLLMGYLRLQQNKLPEAFVSFRKASQLDSADPVSLCMSGLVLEKMGRSNEAIRYYSQALKIKPNDELATSLLAKAQVQE